MAEKWNLWDPWTVYPYTIHDWLGQIVRLEQKKNLIMITKHDFQNVDAQRGIQTSTKGTFGKHVLRFPDAFAFLSFF